MNLLERLRERIQQSYGILARSNWTQQVQYAAATVGERHSLSEREVTRLALQKTELLRELAGLLTIDESYFFRQEKDFDTMVSHAIATIAHQSQSRFIIWSAGCSDGPEPYSAAIALREQLPLTCRSQVSIFASDINRAAVQNAIKGEYGTWSLRGLNDHRRKRYFRSTGNGYRLRDEILAMVDFTWLSLQEHIATFERDTVDCIFFRNVAIYLDRSMVEKLIRQFHGILRPNGLLFVAACDAHLPRDLFQLRYPSWSTYQKVDYLNNIDKPSISLVEPKPSERKPNKAVAKPEDTVSLCERALVHANHGNFSAAITAANSVIEMTTQQQRGYLLRGQINLARDHAEDAVSDLRRAVFTDPQDLLARFWYATALHRIHATRRALVQINMLLYQLVNLEGNKILDDGKTTASELLDATRHLKELTS